MKTRHWLWIGLSVFAVVGLIACGKSTTQNDTNNAVAIAPNSNYGCPSGSTLVNTWGYPTCQGANGMTTPLFQNSIGGHQYSADNYCYRNITVTNTGVFQAFLKEAMGVCNQAHSSGGLADCSAWSGGTIKMEMVTTGQQMNFSIYAYPQVNQYYNYSYQLPSMSQFFLGMLGFPIYTQTATATLNPLSMGMTLFPINNNQGFEGRANGNLYTMANRNLIQLQVAQGKAGDPYFNFVLTYVPVGASQGQAFLSGNLANKAVYGSYYGCY